jgi:hypothetical protein
MPPHGVESCLTQKKMMFDGLDKGEVFGGDRKGRSAQRRAGDFRLEGTSANGMAGERLHLGKLLKAFLLACAHTTVAISRIKRKFSHVRMKSTAPSLPI